MQYRPAHDFIPLNDAGHRRVTEYHVTGIASWGLLGSQYTDLPVEARDASLSSA